MRHANPIAATDALPAPAHLSDPHAVAHALVERQLEMLTRLAEMGMRIAEATERWALAAAEAAAGAPVAPDGAEAAAAAAPGGFRGDPGLAFSRVARAVRLTLMLQTRLLQELPALGRAETLARTAQIEARRERAHRLVERAIRAGHDDADDVEQLSGEAWERLRDEDLGDHPGDDLGDDLGARPLGEVVARICRDLGLSPDWGARAMETAGPPGPAPLRRSPAWPANPAAPSCPGLRAAGGHDPGRPGTGGTAAASSG